jgi:hypothetical protein
VVPLLSHGGTQFLTEFQLNIVRMLLEVGADVEVTFEGQPQVAARWMGTGEEEKERREAARTRWVGVTPLMMVCHHRRAALVTLLLDAGVEADRVSEGGWSALHFACEQILPIEILQRLLGKVGPGHINTLSTEGYTPLMLM